MMAAKSEELLAAAAGAEDRIFSDGFENTIAATIPEDIRALNRLSYGAIPQSRDEFAALGATIEQRVEQYVDQQLNPQAIDDSACLARITAGNYKSLGKSLRQQWEDYAVASNVDRNTPLREIEAARITRAVCSRRQLLERMVEFWHDHFSVFGPRNFVRSVFVHYDRDVIRPHAFGNFRAMLENNAKSTAMLYYLDNHVSRAGGFNENYARELLELHTLGAEVYYPTLNPADVPIGPDGRPAGYSDNDVYEAARSLTGWTVLNNGRHTSGQPDRNTGEFFYFAGWHDTAGKTFLGRFIQANGPVMGDGKVVFDELCSHRATARRLCRKLIRRFIQDEPDPALVESAADIWQAHWQSADQIERVLRHILSAEHLLAPASGKLRRPFELIVALLRLSDSQVVPAFPTSGTQWGTFFSRFSETGQRPFTWSPPDGFPDQASAWAASSVIGMSWRMLSRMVELDASTALPFVPIVDATRARFPDFEQRSARNLVDWWLDRLLGFSPASQRRQDLINFMRQNAGPDEPLELEQSLPNGFSSNSNLSRHFVPARLRAMVGLISMLPEFQVR